MRIRALKSQIKNQVIPVKEKRKFNKSKIITAGILIAVFFLVLFMNSYFNYTYSAAFNPDGDTIGTRYLLSGPDPYYNMRLCQETLRTGNYQFLLTGDPLLNYPLSSPLGHARPPLFNMVAISSTLVLQNFMPQIDALGLAMLFLPAIYGALLVFPTYGIGKELFNKKVGILSAFFLAIIPIHIGSGHGSSLALFDHDSFILLLSVTLFYFIIKAYKEKEKRGYLYACLAAVPLASLYLTWDAFQTVYVMVIAFVMVNFFIDVFRKKHDMANYLKTSLMFGLGFLITLPYSLYIKDYFSFSLITLLFSLAVLCIYYVIKRTSLPWIISIPASFTFSGICVAVLYAVKVGWIYLGSTIIWVSNVFFGSGIYGGTKVSHTIGEVSVFGLSQTVMSYGPALYFLALVGFVIFFYKMLKDKIKPEQLLFVMLFIMEFYLTTQAGRFLNDIVPYIAIFGSFVIFVLIDKLKYKTMFQNIKNIGGLRGLKKFRTINILGVLFLAFVVLLPNTYCALDSAVPPEKKADFFGPTFSGAWGLSLGQSIYWADALRWFSEQDNQINDSAKRPGIISWWDYGFYIVSMGEHPTVADNYQEGIPPASNFHTAQSEDEAISVLIIRVTESLKTPKGAMKGELSKEAKDIFKNYLPDYNESKVENNITIVTNHQPSNEIINILQDPLQYAPSYDTLISPDWGNTVLKVTGWNAMYHDATKILLTLSDEQLISLYRDVRELSGNSILYYGIDTRDLTEIFGVFPFLADKGTHGFVTIEDDFYKTSYVDSNTGREYNETQLNNLTQTQISNMKLTTKTIKKDGYYNSFIFRTFYGTSEEQNQRMPTYGLNHFKIAYVSPYVLITKYYEGANITGNVFVGNESYYGAGVVILDEYGIPHASSYILPDGSFKVTALPGNNSLAVVKDNNIVKVIPLDTPITEEEATRTIESTRSYQINVNLSTFDVNVSGVNETGLTLKVSGPQGDIVTSGIENKMYHFDGLMASNYNIVVTNATAEIYRATVFVNTDGNQYNLTLGG